MNRPRRSMMKKTDEMDHWLDSLDLYRKHIARDGSCLFRAIAEQVFLTQRYHKEVRKQCMDYIEGHKYHFEELLDGSFDEYVLNMRHEHQWGGKVELEAMAFLYKRDMVVYYEVGNSPLKVTSLGLSEKIYLCLSYGNHYDIVYSKEHVTNAAFGQSLVYGILYEGVFNLTEVDYAVDQMLHQKVSQDHRMTFSSLEPFRMQDGKEISERSTNMKTLLQQGVTPFPYKVAKALEPTIYRNIDFDIWSDMRKEMRLASQTAGELQVGMKCLVTLEHSESLRRLVSGGPATCHAHIQKVLPDKGPVEVYVEELGERRMVSHAQLEPVRVRQSNQKPLYIRQYAYRQPFSMSDKGKKKMAARNRKPKPAEQLRTCDEQRSSDQQPHQNVEFPVMTEPPHQMGMYTMPMAPPQQLYVSMAATLPSPSQATPPPQQLFVSMPRQLLNPTSASPMPPPALPVSPPRKYYENVCPPHMMQTPQRCYVTPQATMVPEPNPQLSDNGNTSPVSSAGYATGSPSPPIVEPSEVQIEDVNGNSVNFWAPKSENADGNDLPFPDIATIRFFYNLGHDCFHTSSPPLGAPLCNGENTPPEEPEAMETANEGASPPGVAWQMVDNPNIYRGNCAQCVSCCTYPTVMYYPLDVGPRPLPYCPQMADNAEGGVDVNGSTLETTQPPGENGVLFTPPPPLYMYHPRGGVSFSHPSDYPPNQGNFSPPINGMGFPLTPTPVSYPPTPHGVPFSPTPNQMFTFTPPPPAWFRNQHM